MVWIPKTWSPVARVEVAVQVFGIERMVVELNPPALWFETMLKASLPAACSSQMVSLADWVLVPVEVPKAARPSIPAIEKNGSLSEVEAMWRIGIAPFTLVPVIERKAKGEEDPIPRRLPK